MAQSSEAYSLVVTWTYFILYILIFLIVSIVCAHEVKQCRDNIKDCAELPSDYKASDWTRKGSFTQQYQSLWKKKKVYFQLIPHFFDQATDFGVLFEYWELRHRDDIGISTLHLFWVSIIVIILHRLISSFAIYRLT